MIPIFKRRKIGGAQREAIRRFRGTALARAIVGKLAIRQSGEGNLAIRRSYGFELREGFSSLGRRLGRVESPALPGLAGSELDSSVEPEPPSGAPRGSHGSHQTRVAAGLGRCCDFSDPGQHSNNAQNMGDTCWKDLRRSRTLHQRRRRRKQDAEGVAGELSSLREGSDRVEEGFFRNLSGPDRDRNAIRTLRPRAQTGPRPSNVAIGYLIRPSHPVAAFSACEPNPHT